MTIVALSLGSNCDAKHYLVKALDALQQKFGELQISSVFESEAVGFTGSNFLNLAVVIDTSESLPDLVHYLKELEDQNGRSRQGPKFSGRTLDIDILTYGDLHGENSGIRLPRAEINENAYVLWPLAQVLGSQLHPASDKTYAQLWAEYDKSRQKLWPVNFNWNGRQLSQVVSLD